MKNYFSILFLIIVVVGCEPAPCEVERYILDPVQVKLYRGIPDSTAYQQELLLNSLSYKTKVVFDTTFVMDSIIINSRTDTIYSCELLIDKKSYILSEKDSIEFGNSQAGGTFSLMKLRVDRILYNIQAIDISLWKYRFVQDCGSW